MRPVADIILKAKVDTQELDEAIEETIEKANRLVALLREAHDLANSLSGSKKMLDPLEGLTQ